MCTFHKILRSFTRRLYSALNYIRNVITVTFFNFLTKNSLDFEEGQNISIYSSKMKLGLILCSSFLQQFHETDDTNLKLKLYHFHSHSFFLFFFAIDAKYFVQSVSRIFEQTKTNLAWEIKNVLLIEKGYAFLRLNWNK